MHLRGLDMNLLVALDKLLKEKSITRAGEELRLSQSGMSTALGRLREFFGDQLLIPMGRKMVLTPLAESMVDPVHDVLLQVQALIDHKPGFDPAREKRQITIMASDYVATVFLPLFLRKLHRLAPGIAVDIVSQEDLLHGPLERGEVDLLIVPRQALSSDHPSAPLFGDTYVCVVWRDSRMFGDTLSFDEYMNAHHVVSRFGKTRMPTYDSWLFQRFDTHRVIDVVAMNFTLVPHYIVETDRIATVHSRIAEHYASFLPLRILKPPLDIPEIIECVQWHRYSDKHPARTWLRELILETGRELGDPPAL
jgi:DNA-binding transcriptional LysR family regulator